MSSSKSLHTTFTDIILSKWLEIADHLPKKYQNSQIDNIETLWEIYTRQQGGIRTNLLNTEKHAWAYFFGFHLSNCWRLLNLLDRGLPPKHESFWQKSMDIIDLGAGTGSGTQTLHAWLKSHKYSGELRSTLVDSSKILLQKAKLINSELNSKTIRCLIQDYDLRANRPNTTQVYILSYVCNEITKDEKLSARLIHQFKNKIKSGDDFHIIILDSSHDATHRGMIHFRDALCDIGLKIQFPCPKSEECPIINRIHYRDRCFMNAHTTPPKKLLQTLKKYNRDSLNFDFMGFVFSSNQTQKAIHNKLIGQVGNEKYMECNGSTIEYTNIKNLDFVRGMDTPSPESKPKS